MDIETQKRNVSEDSVLHNKQMQKSISVTKYIRNILSCSSKFDIICKCLCLPYKSKEGLSEIEYTKGKCLYGHCNTCKFSRVWSYFLRKKVVYSEIGSPDEISDSQNENWLKQLICQHYKTRPKPNIAALARLDKDNDSKYTDKIVNALRELVLETHMGTIVYYLDEF